MTPKIRFPMLMICPMSLSRLSLESGERGGGHSPWKHTPEQLQIFAWNLNHDFIWNILAHSSLKSENISCFFLLFAVIFDNFSPYSISYVIKTKYILLKLKAPWAMSAISETYNRGHKIFELVNILLNDSFTTSETERD